MISIQTLPTIAALQPAPSAVSGAPPGGGEDAFPDFLELLAPIAVAAPHGDARQVPSAIGKGLPVVADVAGESVTRPPARTSPMPDPTATLTTFLARTIGKLPATPAPTSDVAPVQPRAIDDETGAAAVTADTRSLVPTPLPLPGPSPVPSLSDARIVCGEGSDPRAIDIDIGAGSLTPAIQSPVVARAPVYHPPTGPAGNQPPPIAAPAKVSGSTTPLLSGATGLPPVQPRAKDEATEVLAAPENGPTSVPTPVPLPAPTLVSLAPDAPVTRGGGSDRRAIDVDTATGSPPPAVRSPIVARDPARHPPTGPADNQSPPAAAPKVSADITSFLPRAVGTRPVQPRAKDEATEIIAAAEDRTIPIPTPVPLPAPTLVSLAPGAPVTRGGGSDPRAIDVDIATGSPPPAIQSPLVTRNPARHPPTDPAGNQPSLAAAPKVSADVTSSLSEAVGVPPVQPRAKNEATEVVAAPEDSPSAVPTPAPNLALNPVALPAPTHVPFAPDVRITRAGGSEPRDAGERIGSAGSKIPSPVVLPDPARPAPTVETAPAIMGPSPAPTPTPTPAPTPFAMTIAPTVRDPQPSRDTVEGDALVPGPPIVTATPLPLIVAPEPGARGPAGRLFAAAIHTASRKEAPTLPAIDTLTPITTPSTALGATTLAVNAAADASRAPLDVRQSDWPARMIDRIEVLRDAADAQDTRIRVVPDALGAIDVALRRDGDTVHVHFSAEQAETRALLGDAQPRLAELAESRGLKLTQGSVGDGTGQPPQRQPRATPFLPAAPARARHETDGTDHRLA